MKAALAVLGLLVIAALTGCVRAGESLVREQAAAAFACADYALHVEEVAPEVYRASGCGQELIYACRQAAPAPQAAHPPGDDVGDEADDPVLECARRRP